MVEVTIDWFKKLNQWRVFVMQNIDTVIDVSDTFLDEDSANDAAKEYQAKYGGKIERLTING